LIVIHETLSLLPHAEPFRLVDEVLMYVPKEKLLAKFCCSRVYAICSGASVPDAVLIEGLAQTAVLFMQLETRPLAKDEIPLMGALRYGRVQPVQWNESVVYETFPLRLGEHQALIEGRIYKMNDSSIVVEHVNFSVAISQAKRN
jgi:3-hydroxyacyl-[acyl-carrier-protein] dehydratase